MSIRSLTLLTLVWTSIATLTRAEDPKTSRRLLAIEDLYSIDTTRTHALSPDGKSAVAVRQWIDKQSGKERSSLWLIIAKDAAKALEAGEPDGRSPVFSPDGKWIAFLSTRSRPEGWRKTPPVPPFSDAATDVWLIPTSGGTAIPLSGPNKPYGRVFNDGFYGRISFSPDSASLVFVADDGKPSATPEEMKAQVRQVREDQGEAYTAYGPAQIWVASLSDKQGDHAASKIERLTDDEIWYGDPQWARTNKSLVVHANKTNDRESVRFSINKNYDLYAIDISTKSQLQLTKGAGPDVSPRISPDGKKIAFLSVPRKGTHRDVFNIGIINLDGGPRTEILFDHQGPNADRPPHLSPSFPLPDDCWDAEGRLVYNAENGVRTEVFAVDLSSKKGELFQIADGKSGMDSLAGRLARRRELTVPEQPLMRELRLGEGKVVTWKNEDFSLEGILTLPPEGVGKAPYPLVLYPHGGPHGKSSPGFDFTVQTFAAHGYAVFQPNFRGSTGRGQKFIDADRGDFGGGDMRDILTGIDQLIKDKIVDAERQFVYGISYGGFMTCWLVGHTNQFRAAVPQNAVTDLHMFWALSDIKSWIEWEFGGRPWEVSEKLRKHSPLTYAPQVKTPTLVLHARDDRRCPLPMGRAFYEALKANGVPTEMIIYPDEGHLIRQPRHREDVLKRTLAWFAKFDKK